MSESLAEPTAVEPVVPEPVAEPAAPSLEEFQALQSQLQELQQVVQPPPPAWQQQQQGPPIPDPFAEDYAQQFQAYTEAQLAPYREFQQQVAMTQAHEQAFEILDQHAQNPAIGEFDRDMAWARANQLMSEKQISDPHKALEQAAKDTREYERRVGEAYHQSQVEQLQTAAGARNGLPAGPAGTQSVLTGGLGNVPNAVTRKFFGTP